MNRALLLVFLLFLVSFSEQTEEKNKIDGLWTVKKVKVGEQQITSIARLVRFNANFTQASGNDWLKHSV